MKHVMMRIDQTGNDDVPPQVDDTICSRGHVFVVSDRYDRVSFYINASPADFASLLVHRNDDIRALQEQGFVSIGRGERGSGDRRGYRFRGSRQRSKQGRGQKQATQTIRFIRGVIRHDVGFLC
ncbi:hypothetical protein EMIT0111MI5_30204 [Burkholderia sp. IT-111MI5]